MGPGNVSSEELARDTLSLSEGCRGALLKGVGSLAAGADGWLSYWADLGLDSSSAE